MDMKSYLTPEEFHHRKIKFVSLRHQIPLRLWAISANVGAAAAALLAARYYSVKCSKVDLENCQFQKKVPQKLWFSLLRWVIRSCLRSNVNKKITFFSLRTDGQRRRSPSNHWFPGNFHGFSRLLESTEYRIFMTSTAWNNKTTTSRHHERTQLPELHEPKHWAAAKAVTLQYQHWLTRHHIRLKRNSVSLCKLYVAPVYISTLPPPLPSLSVLCTECIYQCSPTSLLLLLLLYHKCTYA